MSDEFNLDDFKNNKIGTKEKTTLKPAKVKIVAYTVKTKRNDGEKMQTPLVELMCKHPDNDDLINFSKVKYQRGDKLQVVGLWVQTDEDNNIQKGSALAHVMSHVGAETPSDLQNKEIDTCQISDTDKFLCLKAY